MGIEIIQGSTSGIDGDYLDGDTKAVMFCNTSGWAFGPVFDSAEEALDFLRFCDKRDGQDLRSLSNEFLANRIDLWRAHRKALPLADARECKDCGHEAHRSQFELVVDIEAGEPLCPKCQSDRIWDADLLLL